MPSSPVNLELDVARDGFILGTETRSESNRVTGDFLGMKKRIWLSFKKGKPESCHVVISSLFMPLQGDLLSYR